MILFIVASIFIIMTALAGGIVSRGCGGGFVQLPYALDEFFYAFPYGAVAAVVSLPLAPLAYTCAVIGKRTGHGGGMDLGHSPKEPGNGRNIEKVEFLILPFKGLLSRYHYDALLLGITGILVTAPAGLVVFTINPLAGILLALSGATKPLAYMIGWKIFPSGSGDGPKDLNEATAIGEFLTGFFGWGSLLTIWFTLLL